MMDIKQCLFSSDSIEEREEESEGVEVERKRSLKELFEGRKKKLMEDLEEGRMFQKRKTNKNMIKRTSIKIDLNQVNHWMLIVILIL